MALGLLRFLFVLILALGTIPRKSDGDWCIADRQVPEEAVQQAMDWACANGADCSKFQVGQPCFEPNTVMDHASYAFNSYYQSMKHKGGDCFFNNTAMLSQNDPSHADCKFENNP